MLLERDRTPPPEAARRERRQLRLHNRRDGLGALRHARLRG
jgi:hypothetical protein